MVSTAQIFGTSIMKATLLDTKTQHYRFTAPVLMEAFQRQFPVTLQNFSKFGCTIEKGARVLQARLDALAPHSAVVLEYGGNDCDFAWPEIAAHPDCEHAPHTPLPQFTQRYREMIQLVRSHQLQPVLTTLPPIDADRYFSWFTGKYRLAPSRVLRWLGDVQMIYRYQELYSESVLKLSYQLHCPVVDVRAAFLDKRNYKQLLCQDGIHPNEQGYQLLYQAFAEFAAHPSA